jgi:hypothetical protein
MNPRGCDKFFPLSALRMSETHAGHDLHCATNHCRENSAETGKTRQAEIQVMGAILDRKEENSLPSIGSLIIGAKGYTEL